MASYLEQIPRDILENIAYLCATTSIADLCSGLVLANSNIYHALCLQKCPHLYARIFRSQFDEGCHRVRSTRMDSALAAELLHRSFALRRVRQRDFTERYLTWDLRTILQMLIEGGEKNDEHLSAADFSNFILDLGQQQSEVALTGMLQNRLDSNALVVWLLNLTLSRSRINNISEERRHAILTFLRPFTLSTTAISVNATPPCFSDPSSDRFIRDYEEPLGLTIDSGPSQEKDAYRRWRTTCPAPSFSAIILTFSFIEARPFKIPRHLFQSSSTDTQGPTIEDFNAILSEEYMTPLFEDVKRNNATTFWDTLDLDFCQMVDGQPNSVGAACYEPGSLTGLWEGRYSVALTDEDDLAAFPSGKPMQCVFSEYLCYNPSNPIQPVDALDWELSPNALVRSENGLCYRFKEYPYEKYTECPVYSEAEDEAVAQPLDIVILGETLEDHERAWGGYRFAGRIRRDGSLTFRREAKNSEDGVWTFDGRIHYGAAMVGRWRTSTPSDTAGIHGIFTMHRRELA